MPLTDIRELLQKDLTEGAEAVCEHDILRVAVTLFPLPPFKFIGMYDEKQYMGEYRILSISHMIIQKS